MERRQLPALFLAGALLLACAASDSTDIYVLAPWEIVVGWTLDVPVHAVLTLTLPENATIVSIEDADGPLAHELEEGSYKITIGAHPQARVLYSVGYEVKPYISYSGAFPTANVTVWVPDHLTLVSVNSDAAQAKSGRWTSVVAPADVSFTAVLKEARYTLTQTITVTGEKTKDLTLHVLLAQQTRNQEVLSTSPADAPTMLDGLEYAKLQVPEVKGVRTLTVVQDVVVRTSDDLVGAPTTNATAPDGTYWPVTPELKAKLGELGDSRKAFEFVASTLDYVKMDERKGAAWALSNRRGDCNEFTDLYLALTRGLGVPGLSLSGITGDTGHAWAASYLDGKWRGVDATWGIFGYSPASHVLMSYSPQSSVSNIRLSFYGDRPEVVHDFRLVFHKGAQPSLPYPKAELARTEEAPSPAAPTAAPPGAAQAPPAPRALSREAPSGKEDVPSPAVDEPRQPQRIEPGRTVGQSFTKQEVEASYDPGRDAKVELTSAGLSLSTTELAVAGGAVGVFIVIALVLVFRR